MTKKELVLSTFTDKEIRIIQLICKQKTNEEIAEHLKLSSRTVEGYRQVIIKKTKSKNAIGIAIYAIKNGLFKITK